MRMIQKATVETSVTITLRESELRALDALAGYGSDKFINAFYRELGESYLRPHEEGLRTLLETVRQEASGVLGRASRARGVFMGAEARSAPPPAPPMSSGELYAAIRILEVFAPADPLVTRLQSKLHQMRESFHGANMDIGHEMAVEVDRVEKLPAPVLCVSPETKPDQPPVDREPDPTPAPPPPHAKLG